MLHFFQRRVFLNANPCGCCRFITPSLTQYTQFRHRWSDLTRDIAATFPPVNLFNCVADCAFADSVAGLTWNILSHLELDLILYSSICQLCAFDPLWVVGQSHNSRSASWSNPISKSLCPHSRVSPVSGYFWSLQQKWMAFIQCLY